jgi:hypothetical protein
MKLNGTVLCSKTRLLRLSEMSRVGPVRDIRQFLFKILLLFNWRKKNVFLMYACIVFGVKECFFFLLYKFRINVMHSFVSMLWPVRTAIISSLFSGNLNRESGDDCCVLVISILPLSTILGLFRHYAGFSILFFLHYVMFCMTFFDLLLLNTPLVSSNFKKQSF